uniref:Glycogen synthase n=1 Tax=Magnetococcus massalia (strain MO-1) TaxID=451514 RepID=A0A1S7LI26_MAGMO|nr:GT5 : Glycogen synthase [Candidatus Magnetococcus massalia]
MRVLFVTPELYPLVKTGGLGDVAAALPKALAERKIDVRYLVPGYPRVMEQVVKKGRAIKLGELFGHGGVQLIPARTPDTDLPIWVLDIPTLYDRPGNPYLNSDGEEWKDNAMRFAALSRVAALMGEAGGMMGWRPDVLHCHDWQTGLAPAYLHFSGNRHCKTVFTIHNMQFQGLFPPKIIHEVGLPESVMGLYGMEFHNQASFLKAGLYYSNWLTTVSPTYATEICTPAYGFGMEGLLQSRAHQLHGILNGVDYSTWNPETDPLIPVNYTPQTLNQKAKNKTALQKEMGLTVDGDRPLFGLVSRLAGQKGVDLILETLPSLIEAGGQLALLGSGELRFEDQFREIAAAHPEQIAVHIGYDEAHAHRIQAGADLLLIPSRFEPCGLTQLYAMRYGTLPVVRRTGGLADTVDNIHSPEHGTGFVFDHPDAISLWSTMLYAMRSMQNRPLWESACKRAMQRDFGWAKTASSYCSLYESSAPPIH